MKPWIGNLLLQDGSLGERLMPHIMLLMYIKKPKSEKTAILWEGENGESQGNHI